MKNETLSSIIYRRPGGLLVILPTEFNNFDNEIEHWKVFNSIISFYLLINLHNIILIKNFYF